MMKITNRLAYSQLKTNRSRTLFAIIAIVLSTALTTAVCSFVASGNSMVKGFLGNQYGDYGHTYMVMILIPAIFFGIIIIAMSVVVISNVFRVSATERTAQFGILKCVGATEKQIKSTVMYESIYLSLIGIPIGLATGLALAFLGICVANHFLDGLNALAHIMIQKIDLSMTFVLSWQALLLSILLSLATIVFSAWSPARRAAKCSAVDCIRGTETVSITKKRFHTSPIFARLFGFEGVLASKNMIRSKRKFRSTITALSIGIILFICLGSMSNIATQIIDITTLDIPETVITEYSSARTYRTNKTTGLEESIYLAPVDSKVADTIADELRTYEGDDIYGIGLDLETYQTRISDQELTPSMEQALQESDITPKNKVYTFDVEIITLDQTHYEELCALAKVPVGSNILLNNYNYNDNGYLTDIVPFEDSLRNLSLQDASSKETKYPIQGVLTLDQIPKELLYFNTNPVRLVLPEAQVRGISWYASPSDKKGFIQYANQVMSTYFPAPADAEYMEVGYRTTVYETTDYMKVMNIAVVLISVFLYSFVALLILIGLTNVVSTISTNICMRSREFAVLQSIGMTSEVLRKMLNLESILCSAKALVIGVPVGILITYLISIPIKAAYPIPYRFPGLSILLCILGVLAITFGTTILAVRKLRKQNIIETIRQESER